MGSLSKYYFCFRMSFGISYWYSVKYIKFTYLNKTHYEQNKSANDPMTND
jgi:hypothetical protein